LRNDDYAKREGSDSESGPAGAGAAPKEKREAILAAYGSIKIDRKY